jgi:hypothetical protein
MKTIAELIEWCNGADEEFGDPSVPIGLIFVRYQHVKRPQEEDLVASWSDDASRLPWPALLLDLTCLGAGLVPLDVSINGPVTAHDELMEFGIEQILPGFWYLTPSLNLPGLLHAFVVLYDVPIPAPWATPEAGIVL